MNKLDGKVAVITGGNKGNIKMKKIALFSIVLLFSLFALLSCSSTKNTPKNVDEISSTMEIQFIRSATVTITYKNTKILVDPLLGDKSSEEPIKYSNNKKIPTIQLPIDKNQLIKDVDAVLLTHYHPDHFDLEAERILPKNILIFCQPYDEKNLKDKGFSNLQVIDSVFNWQEITISRFPARHYKGATGAPPFGESSSYFLQTKNETVFFTGDAIFDDRLKSSLTATQPKLIIANTGECQFTEENPVLAPGITMTLTRIELNEMTRLLPESKIIAVHMDAINHCSLTKDELGKYIENEKLEKKIVVPNEGDKMFYNQIINN